MAPEKNDTGLYAATIGGRTYEFEKWGAEAALDTLMDLGAVCGKPFGAAVSELFGQGQSGLDTELDGDFIGQIMSQIGHAFFERKALCRSLVHKLASGKGVFCDGTPVSSFDRHYKDCIEEVFSVARANLEVQYTSFFYAAKGLAATAGKAVPSKAQSIKEASAGSFGGPS